MSYTDLIYSYIADLLTVVDRLKAHAQHIIEGLFYKPRHLKPLSEGQKASKRAKAMLVVGIVCVMVAHYTVICNEDTPPVGNIIVSEAYGLSNQPDEADIRQITQAILAVQTPAVAQEADLVEPTPIPEPTVAPTPEPTARYPLSATERDYVERVVQAESGGEDFDGKCLVAQCVLNTSEATGQRPDAVVLAVNKNGTRQYAVPAAEASEAVKKAVAAVFDDGYMVTEEPVRYFYAWKYSTSTWHENCLVFVLQHGGHRFFKAP